nr:MAG TPA: Endonuclease/Exonuclease/phosphatase family protein [Caudoviricetes sp.]
MQIHIRNLRLSFPFLGPSGTRIVWFGDFNGKMTAVRVFENLPLMPNQTIRI